MTTKTTTGCERRAVWDSASRVQRAALFDGDGRLVWSSAIQPPSEFAAPRSALRSAMSHRQLLRQWLAESGAPDVQDEIGGRSLGWNVERDVDVVTQTGRVLQLVQRRTPDGGALVLLIDESGRGHRAGAIEPSVASDDTMRLAMTEAVSWLSQELRTSFNSILGFAQLMQRDAKEPLSPRQRSRADEIVKVGDQVASLLDGLLELRHAELARVSLAIAPTDAWAVAEASRASLAPLASRARVELSTTTRVPAAAIPLVLADPAWLQQILTTLGRRAIEQQRPPATVTLELSVPRDGVVRMTVSDNGVAVPAAAQAALFQPLRSVRGSMGLDAAGLPLAIAHRLAELMHGQLGVRSGGTQGTDVWIDIPACQGRP